MSGDCYCTMLRAAVRRLSARYDAALAPAGIGVAQFSLLRRIDRAGRPSLSEIARLTELDRSTVGRNIRVLERDGLVATAPGDDQRELVVELSDGGRAVLARAAPLWEAAQAEIDAAIGAEDAAKLSALVARL